MNIVTLDFETTTRNKGHPFTPENRVISYALKTNSEKTIFKYYDEPDFLTTLRTHLSNASMVIGFNIKFDLHWCWRMGLSLPDGCNVYDCSLAEFILTGQEASMVSLDETLATYGLPAKQDKVAEYWALGMCTSEIPPAVLEEYNILDVDLTYALYLAQLKVLNDKQLKLVYLEGEDLLSLAAAEQAGILFDREEAVKKRAYYLESLSETQRKLRSYLPEIPEGAEFNWNSGDHLSALLYGGAVSFEWRTEETSTYKSGPKKGEAYQKGTWHSCEILFPSRFKPLEGTLVKKCTAPDYKGTLFYQVDDPTLKQLKSRRKEDKELLEFLAETAKHSKIIETIDSYTKLIDTYGWEGNIIHGQYNQNIARTGRLSSSKPNMQNTDEVLDSLLISRYD